MAISNNLLIIGSPYRDAVETFRLKPAIEVKLTTKWLPTKPIQFEAQTIRYQVCARYKAHKGLRYLKYLRTLNAIPVVIWCFFTCTISYCQIENVSNVTYELLLISLLSQITSKIILLTKALSVSNDTPMRLRFELKAEHDGDLGRTDSRYEESIITMNHDKDFCSQFTFNIINLPHANKIQSLPIKLRGSKVWFIENTGNVLYVFFGLAKWIFVAWILITKRYYALFNVKAS